MGVSFTAQWKIRQAAPSRAAPSWGDPSQARRRRPSQAELSRAQVQQGWEELARSGPSQAKQSAFVAMATDNTDIGKLLNCMANMMLPKWPQNQSQATQSRNHKARSPILFVTVTVIFCLKRTSKRLFGPAPYIYIYIYIYIYTNTHHAWVINVRSILAKIVRMEIRENEIFA